MLASALVTNAAFLSLHLQGMPDSFKYRIKSSLVAHSILSNSNCLLIKSVYIVIYLLLRY